MKRDQFTMPLGFSHALLIDNFAGSGGASTGIEQAFGRPVDVAINHDGEALAMHEAKPLTKTAQVRMIGNSLCPPLARAILQATFTHELQIARTA